MNVFQTYTFQKWNTISTTESQTTNTNQLNIFRFNKYFQVVQYFEYKCELAYFVSI